MPDFEMPLEVEIELPDNLQTLGFDSRGMQKVPMYTKLHRREAIFGTVFGLMGERFASSEDIAVVSAPSSVGAEADSFLSLYEALGYCGKVSLRGYDIDPEAIRRARLGRHLLPRFLYFKDELKEQEEDLVRMGFECDFDQVVDEPGATNFGGYHVINSGKVREGHDVTFEVADLREGLPNTDEPEADLTMANNIFYHLHPDEADKILEALASNVSQRGILSLGDILGSRTYTRLMGRGEIKSPLMIGDWILQRAKVLAKNFDLKPVHYKQARSFSQEIPIIFARA